MFLQAVLKNVFKLAPYCTSVFSIRILSLDFINVERLERSPVRATWTLSSQRKVYIKTRSKPDYRVSDEFLTSPKSLFFTTTICVYSIPHFRTVYERDCFNFTFSGWLHELYKEIRILQLTLIEWCQLLRSAGKQEETDINRSGSTLPICLKLQRTLTQGLTAEEDLHRRCAWIRMRRSTTSSWLSTQRRVTEVVLFTIITVLSSSIPYILLIESML